MNELSQSLFSQSQVNDVTNRKGRRHKQTPENQLRITQYMNKATSQPHENTQQEINPSQPVTLSDPDGNAVRLRAITELPQQYRSIFKFPHFNIVQSKIFDKAIYSDDPIVLCAPTGSGKTVLFEMAITRLLINCQKNNIALKNIKIIYMAPIKALCSERYEDWKSKFEPLGMVCKELTGDSDADDFFSLRDASLIFTTPEKWDSVTRRWKDNKSFIKQIRIFMIDEVHLLNDETRGATVEAVISRMKLVSRQLHGDKENMLRIVAVSATLANFNDVGISLNCPYEIAEWLGGKGKSAIAYKMDDRYRPVTLARFVYGYSANQKSDFKFDFSLNYKLPEIIQRHSKNRPTLIFVSTRKGTQQTATQLGKELRLTISAFSRQKLQTASMSLRDSNLRDNVVKGVGFHNAGLDYSDRRAIEELFLTGDLLVLVSTSTLAMGVNLPAHLVIIKSTQHYTSNGFEEYSESELLQMIGRAGRPQFDTSASAVIMTKMENRSKYERLVGGKQIIESSLHKNLIEHVNAEIVLGTIPRLSVALNWLKSTFLYVRIMKNPNYYGLRGHQTRASIEAYLQQLCLRQLNLLQDIRIISSDSDSDSKISSTESGKLMARYCVSYDTMCKIDQLSGQETQEQLIDFLANCKEFNDIQLRVADKKVLNELNKSKTSASIRYPMKGKIKTSAMKVNCLMQVELGCLPLSEFSLNQDTARVFRTACRITKCLVELYMVSENAGCLYNAAILNKCISAHLWENSSYVTKQLPGIGIKNASCFTNAGIHSFSKLTDSHPRDVELICNRHPPFGNTIIDMIKHLPKYEMALDQQVNNLGDTRASVTVALRLANADEIGSKAIAKHHCAILLIYDADNRITLSCRIYDSTLVKAQTWSKLFTVQRALSGDELQIRLLSLSWVGLDICSTFTPRYSGPAYQNYRQELKSQQAAQNRAASARGVNPRASLHQPCNKSHDSGLIPPVTTCGHRCLNKKTCGHLCCKPKIPQRNTTGACRTQTLNQHNDSELPIQTPSHVSYRQQGYLQTQQRAGQHQHQQPQQQPQQQHQYLQQQQHQQRTHQQQKSMLMSLPVPRSQQQSNNASKNDMRPTGSRTTNLPRNFTGNQPVSISRKLSQYQRTAPPQYPVSGTMRPLPSYTQALPTPHESTVASQPEPMRHPNMEKRSTHNRTFGDFDILGVDSSMFSLNNQGNEMVDDAMYIQESRAQNIISMPQSPPLSLQGYSRYNWNQPDGMRSGNTYSSQTNRPASYCQPGSFGGNEPSRDIMTDPQFSKEQMDGYDNLMPDHESDTEEPNWGEFEGSTSITDNYPSGGNSGPDPRSQHDDWSSSDSCWEDVIQDAADGKCLVDSDSSISYSPLITQQSTAVANRNQREREQGINGHQVEKMQQSKGDLQPERKFGRLTINKMQPGTDCQSERIPSLQNEGNKELNVLAEAYSQLAKEDFQFSFTQQKRTRAYDHKDQNETADVEQAQVSSYAAMASNQKYFSFSQSTINYENPQKDHGLAKPYTIKDRESRPLSQQQQISKQIFNNAHIKHKPTGYRKQEGSDKCGKCFDNKENHATDRQSIIPKKSVSFNMHHTIHSAEMFPRSSSQNSNWLTDSLSNRIQSAETDKSVGHRFYGLVKDECHRDYSISNSRTESLAQDSGGETKTTRVLLSEAMSDSDVSAPMSLCTTTDSLTSTPGNNLPPRNTPHQTNAEHHSVDRLGNTVRVNLDTSSKWISSQSKSNSAADSSLPVNKSYDENVRRSNLKADVLDRSVSVLKKKSSAFGQTLKRTHQAANLTATVRPLIHSTSTTLTQNQPKGDRVLIPEPKTASDDTTRSEFDGLELIMMLKRKKK